MVNTYPDLFWAYTAVWGALAFYIVSLGGRLAKIEKKLPQDDTTSSEA
jgi:CcmD family protein